MRVFFGLFSVLLITVLSTGCKNRFETYEPYSTFDERMAAAEMGQPYEQQDPYAGQYAYTNDEQGYAEQPRSRRITPEMRQASVARSANTEVPFDSSRGAKHAMNIGAMED